MYNSFTIYICHFQFSKLHLMLPWFIHHADCLWEQFNAAPCCTSSWFYGKDNLHCTSLSIFIKGLSNLFCYATLVITLWHPSGQTNNFLTMFYLKLLCTLTILISICMMGVIRHMFFPRRLCTLIHIFWVHLLLFLTCFVAIYVVSSTWNNLLYGICMP